MPEERKKIERPDIYGYMAMAEQPTPEEQAIPVKINDMLQSQWQAASDQRTNAHKLAQVTALGNVLQNIFTPVAWRAGGQGKATSQPITPDNRAYITAFNEAIKADQNLSNVGNQSKQLLLNYEMDQAARARARKDKWAEMEYKQAQNDYIAERNLQNELLKIQTRFASREELERTKADLKSRFNIVGRDGKTPDDKEFEKIVMYVNREYAKQYGKYIAGQLPEGYELPSKEEFFKQIAPEWGWRYEELGGGKTRKKAQL